MKKCKHCRWLNYNFMMRRYESFTKPLCGYHGMCTVDLKSDVQVNLDGRGGCCYAHKIVTKQLLLFD